MAPDRHPYLDARQVWRHKLRNGIQSLLLIGGMGLLTAACAWIILGPDGMVWAVAAIVLGLALGPAVRPGYMLALYGARPVHPREFPEGHAILRELACRAGLPAVPALYLLPSPTLNAFAVGSPRNGAMAVTVGLIRIFTLRELAAVMAHEISHIRHNDLWIMGVADAVSRLTALLSYAGIILLMLNLPLLLAESETIPWLLVVLLIFAPTLGSLLQLALSRAREYDADLDAAGLTGDPAGLVSALAKLERCQGRFWEEILLPGRRIPEPSVLRTHPPTEERIRRLRELCPAAREPVILSDRRARPPTAGPVHAAPRWHWPGLWY